MEGQRKEGAVTVRIARSDQDLDSFVELAREAHQESRYKDVSYDPDKRRDVWRERIVDRKGSFAVFLASYQNEDVGILIATIGSFLFTEDLQAQCYGLFVRPTNRNGTAAMKLLHAYRIWAEQQGVRSMSVHVTSGVRLQSTDRLLRRIGFEQTGGNYEFRLDGASTPMQEGE